MAGHTPALTGRMPAPCVPASPGGKRRCWYLVTATGTASSPAPLQTSSPCHWAGTRPMVGLISPPIPPAVAARPWTGCCGCPISRRLASVCAVRSSSRCPQGLGRWSRSIRSAPACVAPMTRITCASMHPGLRRTPTGAVLISRPKTSGWMRPSRAMKLSLSTICTLASRTCRVSCRVCGPVFLRVTACRMVKSRRCAKCHCA